MLELTGPITHVEPAPHGLLWAALAIPLIAAALCALLGERVRRWAVWIAAGVALVTCAAIVAATVALLATPQPGAALYAFAYPLLRIGTLDVPLALALDRLGVVLSLSVTFGGGAALVGGALSMGPKAPGLVRMVGAGSAAIGGLLLICLADNAVLLFAGWQVTGLAGAFLVGLARSEYPRASDALRVFVIGRLGDAALLTAIALLFWGMGGAWLADGRFSSDYHERFIAVETEAGQSVGSMVAIPGGDLPSELLTGKGRLTQVTYPGARVFLGITTEDQLGPNPTPFGIAPFYDQPLPPGLHKIAIFPGRGATVGGDGNEAALIDVVDIAAGGAYRVVPIGSTVSFREIADQLALKDADGSAALWIALRNKRFPYQTTDSGMRLPTAIALLLALAAIARAAQVPFGGLMASARNAPGAALALIAGLVVVVPSAALLARFHYLFDPRASASAILGTLGAIGAVVAALRAVEARRSRDMGAWLAVSHMGLVAIAIAVGAVGAAVGLAVHAALWTVAVALACAAKAPKLEAGAIFWAAGVIPFGGFWARHDLIRTSLVVDGVSILPIAWFAAAVLATFIVGLAAGHRVAPALANDPPKRKKGKQARESGSPIVARAAVVAFAIALVGSAVACLPGFVWGGGATALDTWLHVGGPASPAPPGGLWVAALSLLAVVGGASAGRRRASGHGPLLPSLVSGAMARLEVAPRGVERGVFAARRVAREVEEGVIDLPARLVSSGVAAGWARLLGVRRNKAFVFLIVAVGAAVAIVWALVATASVASAHEEGDTPPSPVVLPHPGPAHLEVSASSVELVATDGGGYTGTFEIHNTGPGTLSITRIWIPTVAEETLLPPGSGVVLEQAGKSTLLAPGQKKKAIVTWTGQTRARELYGHVLIASNAVDPTDKTLRGPVAVGIHAEKAGGPLGWLGAHILSLLIWLPLAGGLAVGVAFAAGMRGGLRRLALAVATLELLLAGWLYAFLDRGMTIGDGHRGYQFIEKAVLAPSAGVHYFIGVDGISTPFVALAALLSWIAIWIVREDSERVSEQAALGLIAAGASIGVFVALDLMLMLAFYLVLVVTLAFWIACGRTRAALRAGSRFGLVGLAGGVLLLLAFTWLGLYGDASYLADGTRSAHTFSVTDLELVDWMGKRLRMGTVLAVKPVVVALILGFGALVPLFPLHTWAPDAADNGSTGAALFALGIATKIGVYGLLRVGVGIVPHAFAWAAPGLAALAVAGLVYAAFVALAAKDLKRLVGYAAVSQMGLALLGVAAMTPQGFEGALTVGVAHALAAPLLLVVIGALGTQAQTTLIDRFGGLARVLPRHTALFAVGLAAAIGAPGLLGFWGDVLTLVGAFARYRALATIAGAGLLLLAGVYAWVFVRVVYGRLRASWKTSSALASSGGRFVDLSGPTVVAAAVLVLLSAALGVWPRPLLDTLEKRVLELHRGIDQPGQTQIARRTADQLGQPHA